MRTAHPHRILVPLVGVVVLLTVGAACSKSSDTPVAAGAAPSSAAVTTATSAGGDMYGNKPSTTSAAAAASIALAKSGELGSIIVDDKGMTLYVFDKDTGTASTCNGSCAQLWPPAAATGTPAAGTGLDSSKLSTTTRSDGTKQLTYNGHPLYRFAQDMAAGDTKGQGVGGIWYVVGADGNKVDKD